MTAYQITSMMEGVVQRGTATVVKEVGKPIAGKTGTTNDEKDAWFIGFSPDLVVGVYLGYDKPRHLGRGATGGVLAAPIVRDFMKMALADKPAVPFRVPAGIKLIRIDAKSGMRAGPGDQRVILEAFKPGTAPPDNYSVIGVTDADGRPLGVSPEADRGVRTGTRAVLTATRRALCARAHPGGASIHHSPSSHLISPTQTAGMMRSAADAAPRMPLRLAPALPAQPSPKCGRGERRPAMVRRQPPCRPSLVALLSSFRTAPFVPAAPFGAASRPSCSHRPGEGPVERRQAHSSLPSRLRGAISRACEARTVPLQPGRPLGAPPWRFSAGDPRCRLRQWHRSRPAICPLPGHQARRAGSRTSRAAVSRRKPQDATPRSACRIVSGDAPHERGYESCVT